MFSNFALCMYVMPLQVAAVGKHLWGSRTAACSICSGTSCFTVFCLQVADFEEHEYDSRTGLDKERISRHLGNRVSPSCIPALLHNQLSNRLHLVSFYICAQPSAGGQAGCICQLCAVAMQLPRAHCIHCHRTPSACLLTAAVGQRPAWPCPAPCSCLPSAAASGLSLLLQCSTCLPAVEADSSCCTAGQHVCSHSAC